MSKRYQLFKLDSSDPNAARPCAFFNTDKGCKSGESCKFIHGDNDPRFVQKQQQHQQQQQQQRQQQQHQEGMKELASSSSNGDSSKKRKHKKEKEEDKKLKKDVAVVESQNMQQSIQQMFPVAPVTMEKTQQDSHQVASYPTTPSNSNHEPKGKEKSSKKKRKDKSETKSVVPPGFEAQLVQNDVVGKMQLPVSPFTPGQMKRDEEEDSSFLFGVVNTALAQGQVQSPQQTENHMRNSIQTNHDNIFLNRNDVNARLQTSGTDHATQGHVAKKAKTIMELPPQSSIAPALQQGMGSYIDASGSSQQVPQSKPPSDSIQPPAPVYVDERVINWRPAVLSTVSHPRFSKDYGFAMDASWVQAKPYGDWCKKLPPIVAMDCEMCETADPVTGIKDSSALIRFSMVNGLNPKEVIIDSLVNPMMPITSMRNHIHGINEDSLRNVQFTLRHAQAILMNTISDRTIIVGHALHHDLKSLKFSHSCVVDTSYLYQVSNEPGAAPGLRDCAQQALGQSLSPLHDSVEDSQVSLMLALHVVNNGIQAPILRSASSENKSSLMIHRIPKNCSEDQLKQMFASATFVIPKSISPIQFSTKDSANSMGRTDAIFESIQHADLAFETLPGPDRPDKSKRSQKRVYLNGGGYICVRKY